MKLRTLLLVVFCLRFDVAIAETLPATQPARHLAGQFTVVSTDVGTVVDLTGTWEFKPSTGEVFLPVPVPQMLSRIQWWLDDSEDFKKWEQNRLDALGFDIEKTDSGVYRATIDVPRLPPGRHVWVEFDGVAMQCKAFCNDQPLGEHKGMFSRFGYDLTPFLRPGKNTLTVQVSMEKIPPTNAQLGEAVTVNLSAAKVVSMSKGMFGPLTPNKDNRAYDLYGIWQPVKLVVRGTAKIEDVWFQPTLTGAKVQVEASVPGMGTAPVRAKVIDLKTNQPIAEWTGEIARAEASRSTVTIDGDGLSPKLWTPSEPNLYRLEVSIGDEDKWSANVGFRTFEIKGNQFYLNGKPYWLRGANQLPYGKNPWDPSLARKLVQFMHDGNLRFTRTHATPWNQAWLDAADEIGLAVSIEGIRPWAFAGKAADGKTTIMPPPEIFQHWLMENEDVVRRCRNHPSVFLFTVGNEMLLRDSKNMEKWKLLSEVTKQTRKLAPNHPIVVSSDYVRDPEYYESTLKPAGIDDGDIDDMHRYNGWYADSPFVIDSKFEKEAKVNQSKRPLIGQEMSSGYPDLDSGLPVLRYTRDLLTPQAWVGNLAYPENDPKWFLQHHKIVTKRWAENLRAQRANTTAGFSLFSVECWFSHSYDPQIAAPYPVCDAVKEAFAPVGISLASSQRRFYAGAVFETQVRATNDDEQFRDMENLAVICEFDVAGTKAASAPVAIAKLPYYGTASVAVRTPVPAIAQARQAGTLLTRLMQGDKEISRTTDDVEIFAKPQAPATRPANVVVIESGQPLSGLAEGQPLRKQVGDGATAIVLAPGKAIVELFPTDLLDAKADVGEFADFAPCAGTKLAEGLQPMDLKWWARKDDHRAFVAASSHRLKPGGKGRELIRFIPAHSYIAKERVPDQYRVVLSEIPLGKGRVWICDLAINDSIEIDPAARIFADNLYRAAGDAESTRSLPTVAPHEELLKGKR